MNRFVSLCPFSNVYPSQWKNMFWSLLHRFLLPQSRPVFIIKGADIDLNRASPFFFFAV